MYILPWPLFLPQGDEGKSRLFIDISFRRRWLVWCWSVVVGSNLQSGEKEREKKKRRDRCDLTYLPTNKQSSPSYISSSSSKKNEQDAIWTRAGFPTAALMQHRNHLVTCPNKSVSPRWIEHLTLRSSVVRSPNWAIKTNFWFKNLREVRLPGIEPGSNRWQRSILAIGPQTH